ncbi:MAG: 50S ribosomal protein L29 [Clostridia bacterium]|nr:50S ribosomal protein L29 [Clostridia bacterium]
MRANDLRDKSADKLNEELANLKQELFQLRFQLAINQLENPMRIKAVKKDIARVKTVLRENEIKAANGTEV